MPPAPSLPSTRNWRTPGICRIRCPRHRGPCAVLGLRQEPRTEFTSRYLAKFATELTVDNLRITGGIIPLAELRDTNRPDLNLRGRNLASHDVLVLSRMLNSVKHIQTVDLSSNVIAYESAYYASTNPRAYDLSGLLVLATALARLPLLSLDLSG